MSIRSVVIAGVVGLAAGCGGGSAAPGTVKGQTFSPSESISNSAPVAAGSSSSAGIIVIANSSGLCADVNANKEPKNLQGLLITLEDVNQTTFATTAPTAPGVYDLSGSAARYAFVAFQTNDASCQEISSQSAAGATGTVTVSSVSNGAYTGSYDVIFDSGDHLTGSFNATQCAGISTLFGPSSNPTCI
jgi:hypothetical protein